MATPTIPTSIEPNNGCISSAMNIIGRKWTALILRDLMSGPKRFCELERSVGNINPRTLSARLDDLEITAIISRDKIDGYYKLSAKGKDLLPILQQMANWGVKYPH